jgi:hypothetical protein
LVSEKEREAPVGSGVHGGGLGEGVGEALLVGLAEGTNPAVTLAVGVGVGVGGAAAMQAVIIMEPAAPTAALAVAPRPMPVVDCTTTGFT